MSHGVYIYLVNTPSGLKSVGTRDAKLVSHGIDVLPIPGGPEFEIVMG